VVIHIQAGTVIGGNNTLQAAIQPQVHKAPDVHQSLIVKDHVGGGTVESKCADFHKVTLPVGPGNDVTATG
jgi:hypothetical protein